MDSDIHINVDTPPVLHKDFKNPNSVNESVPNNFSENKTFNSKINKNILNSENNNLSYKT